MISSLKNKHAGFLLVGGAIALVFLTGALGWRMAQPSAALPEIQKPDGAAWSSKSQSLAEKIASMDGVSSKSFPVSLAPRVAPQVTAEDPIPTSASPASNPRPVPREILPPAFMTEEEKVTIVDPSLPGNFLVANGQQVSIQQMITGGPVKGMALDVVVTSVAEEDASAQSKPHAVPDQTSLPRAGFTYEQQLFRSKWGWAAYDAANRATTWDLQKRAPPLQ